MEYLWLLNALTIVAVVIALLATTNMIRTINETTALLSDNVRAHAHKLLMAEQRQDRVVQRLNDLEGKVHNNLDARVKVLEENEEPFTSIGAG